MELGIRKACPTLFENDHYRYIWEGKVVAAGENPYKHAPKSKELKHIEYEHKKKIAYNKLTSIYPPLSQVFFLFAAGEHCGACVDAGCRVVNTMC